MLKRKYIALNAYMRNKKWSQVNNPHFYFNKLEREAQNKPKASIREEKIKMRTRAEINKIKMENNREYQ